MRSTQRDLDFLQGYANVIASAVRCLRRGEALRAESDARAVLLREQQHRVRNNLMAITAMLQGGEGGATPEDVRARVGAVRQRVFALASLYDHLLSDGLSGGATDLRDYLAVLCDRAHDFYGLAARGIALSFEAGEDAVRLGIDACTALGVVVNELIANAVEHAFGHAGGGRIAVELGRDERGRRVVTVADNGIGVPPGAENGSLGLGFARRLLERMGFSLALRAAPGRTVWTIALPERAQA